MARRWSSGPPSSVTSEGAKGRRAWTGDVMLERQAHRSFVGNPLTTGLWYRCPVHVLVGRNSMRSLSRVVTTVVALAAWLVMPEVAASTPPAAAAEADGALIGLWPHQNIS